MDSSTAAAPPPEAEPKGEPGRKLEKVFISYEKSDRDFALKLAADLDKEGVDVWIDTTEIEGGEDWIKKLKEAIQAHAVLVLVDSPASQNSKWVGRELRHAQDFNRAIIPVLIGNCPPRIEINELQRIDFTKLLYKEAFAKLMTYPIPPRSLWGEMLAFLKRNRIHFYVIAAIIAVVLGLYHLLPSSTSFTVGGGDASSILVDVHNRGGQPSMLAGDSFELDFDGLPIETQKLVLQDPHNKSLIPGHSEVQISLVSPTPLTPKSYPGQPYFFYNEEEILPLLANAKLTLRGSIEESNDRRQRRSHEVQAKDIETFIKGRFPDVVPRAEIDR